MNIKRAIEKLDEVWVDSNLVCFDDLKEILLALSEPSEDKQFTKEILTTVGNIEERLSRLEERMDSHVFLEPHPEPNKPMVLNRSDLIAACEHEFITESYEDKSFGRTFCHKCGYQKLKPSTECEIDEKSIHANYCPSHYGKKKKCICNKDGKPSECEHLWASIDGHNVYKCNRCGLITNDVNRYSISFPSDTIQIDRKVAEEYAEFMSSAQGVSQDMYSELRKALEGK